MKKPLALFLTLAFAAGLLAACTGPSEADKAYEAWAENVAGPIADVDVWYKDIVAQAQQTGDVPAVYAALGEYLSVLQPAVEGLAGIDAAALTGKYKDEYPAQLQELQSALAQYQQQYADYEQMLGG